MLHQNPVVSDLIATGLSGTIALSFLRSFEETAKRHIFDQKLNRKLMHISIGLVFMLCWPMFSSGHRGALLAACIPGLNIIRMLLIGSGMWKDEATVKSMSRFGDRRELLKGPLYYALTITVACAIYWRTSPVAIAAICNLCAGDGIADIVGRRLGSQKIPYNRNKSIAGSVAMALAGFLASLGLQLVRFLCQRVASKLRRQCNLFVEIFWKGTSITDVEQNMYPKLLPKSFILG
ncbi:probable phytol kinase 3, chloroplastic isoform X2 [Populus trichocarpa]|uniref:probable phytol kinase 3, chloroplastic isoform X2 n=1 Tax=Populus trichocarpa TaxID=3694 RepID=UPI002278DE54|nr:probable phytol kinase 3, chloroplastic isoform X2 [Populus trichocarpa]